MKLKKLKEILNSQPEENGELEVRVFADHGQQAIPVSGAEKGWIDEDVYMAEEIDPDDLEKHDDAVPVFIISN